MIPGFGAGVGRFSVFRAGNWYRGGALQMLFIAWLSGQQNQVRLMFPPNTTRRPIRASSHSIWPTASAGGLVAGAAHLP
jgi:hypothetical protein